MMSNSGCVIYCSLIMSVLHCGVYRGLFRSPVCINIDNMGAKTPIILLSFSAPQFSLILKILMQTNPRYIPQYYTDVAHASILLMLVHVIQRISKCISVLIIS